MIVYNPHQEKVFNERIKQAETLLKQLPYRYCFITGSFLHQEKYKDIDLFVISRSKKRITLADKKVKITFLDFNQLASLFHHSISKSCLAKNLLPHRPLKVTLTDYWRVINEAIPTLLNQKEKYSKEIRSLILYSEYFKSREILDTFQLSQRVSQFKSYQEVLGFVKKEIPTIIAHNQTKSYLKKFSYTQAGYYQEHQEYPAQEFLYQLTHLIAREVT